MVILDENFFFSLLFGIGVNWISLAHWIELLLYVHTFGMIKISWLYAIYCDPLMLMYVYYYCHHLLNSSLFT